MAKFLFLLTVHGRWDELKYASCVARRIAEQVRSLGHEVILVNEPTPQMANEAIRRYRPNVVWWVGHGNVNITTLEHIQVWIESPSFNTDILDGTIACALSCLTGVELGKYVTHVKKCIAYLGYTKEFWFLWCVDPRFYNCACSGRNPWNIRPELWEKMVTCMHEANLYFVLGLAKGMNTKDATDYSINRFKYWINYFRNVKPENRNEYAALKTTIWILGHNMSATILWGRKDVTVPGGRAFNKMEALPLAIIAIGSLVSYIGDILKSSKR